MERTNNLSKNLKDFQAELRKTLTEFSKELGIAKSTVQSAMESGNTTLDTAIRMAERLGVTLDDLVFGKNLPDKLHRAQNLLDNAVWYTALPEEKQIKVKYHVDEILEIIAE